MLGIVFGKHFSTLLFLIRKLAKGHTHTPYCSRQDSEQRATSRQIAFKFKTRLLSVFMPCFSYVCVFSGDLCLFALDSGAESDAIQSSGICGSRISSKLFPFWDAC